MDDRGPDDYFDFMRRGIRNMDIVVLASIYSLMVVMSLVVRNLTYVDVFILNLVHSIDTFMVLGDWRKGGISMFFGMAYLAAACNLSLHLAIPCVSCVIISWIVSCFRYGYPPFSWVFFPYLTMWCLKFIYKCAPDTIVVIAMVKTAFAFVNTGGKSLEDSLLICSLIAMHVSFALEDHFHYLLVAYWLSFVWMWLKPPSRRR